MEQQRNPIMMGQYLTCLTKIMKAHSEILLPETTSCLWCHATSVYIHSWSYMYVLHREMHVHRKEILTTMAWDGLCILMFYLSLSTLSLGILAHLLRMGAWNLNTMRFVSVVGHPKPSFSDNMTIDAWGVLTGESPPPYPQLKRSTSRRCCWAPRVHRTNWPIGRENPRPQRCSEMRKRKKGAWLGQGYFWGWLYYPVI